ncbi:putative fructokinase-6, chloroplastic [Drosera capensis]
MRFDPCARTALAFVTLKKDGEREFMFYRNPSADILLQESELDFDLIKKLAFSNQNLYTKAAKEAGVLLSYDPNLRLPLWPSAESVREGILSIWDTADIIKRRRNFFSDTRRHPYDDNFVRKLYHPNLKVLLVTEGPEGCRYYTKEFNGRVKGLKVEAVDTTGAGIIFIVDKCWNNSLSCWTKKQLRDALYFANACGALTVTERGAIPTLPTKEADMAAEDTPQDVADRERIFKRFDANGDGKISSTELGDALKGLGSVTPDEVQRMMAEIDTDGDGFISLEEFTAFAQANHGLIRDVAKIF